jgi:HSP20 family protein
MTTTLTRWDPFQQIAQLQRELDRAFRRETPDGDGRQAGWMPAVDVEQTDDSIVLKMDLPGMRREDVSIEVKNQTLTVSGERQQEREQKHEGYYNRERVFGRFSRTFMLPEGVDADDIEATFSDGVLTVSLPRPREDQPKSIEIKSESPQTSQNSASSGRSQ